MRACYQFRTQNVLEHGDAVWERYRQLLHAAKRGRLPEGWRRPKWWTEEAGALLLEQQPTQSCMQNYLRYHDCGKPLCLTVDAEGRSHFPDHAHASSKRWQDAGGAPDEVWLMAQDMALHCGSAAECETLRGHPLLPGLMFAALAELHSNAEMFGGVETASFKAKAKHLERRTAQLLKTA